MEEIMARTGPFLPEEISRMSEDLFDGINAERQKNGREALSYATELSDFGRVRAWETIQSFSHTRPNGESFWGVEYEGSVRVLGEVFFRTKSVSKNVIQTFMKSEAHRDLMLDPAFHTIGISVERKSPDEYHFVILFGGKVRD
ncbi:MAG: CAP domain-containing protein [Lachnospiraceae bacterium]|nr:CAP domain-containing protein [Lachnospiraceae bacterium]